MAKRIALFGGSFNPPTRLHEAVARLAAAHFDGVHVIPCGRRPDKESVDDVSPGHRAAMADLAFGGLPRVHVLLDDLERDVFTRTAELDARFRSAGDEVWHVVGSDLLAGGARGASEIQARWLGGRELWERLNFAVVRRAPYPLAPDDLPPHARILGDTPEGSSTQARDRLFHRQAADDLLSPAVAAYAARWRLYRGAPPPDQAVVVSDVLQRPLALADPEKPDAMHLAAQIQAAAPPGPPTCIAVIGGDGFFLEMLRAHGRRRLPFVGLNAGHRGFFMNRLPPDPRAFFARTDLRMRRTPFLRVRIERADGSAREHVAVNDAWLERASGQTAWLRVSVDGQERIACLRADGAIVATPIGSTGYVRAMGAAPLFDVPGLVLAGSNVDQPLGWKPVNLPSDTMIRFELLDADKRPVRAMVDSLDLGPAAAMEVRGSRTAAAELVFAPEDDLPVKRLAFQFPSA